VSPLSPTQVNELLHEAAPNSTIFLIGAGGCGMSGLGHLLLDLGFSVAGSDLAVSEEIHQIRSRGGEIHIGHDPQQVVAARPLLAVYSSAIKADNPELLAAQEMRVPILRRAVLLAALMLRQRGVCVAGMHGKTTTTALLAFALERLGAGPSYAVGSLVPQLERHARFSQAKQPYFVAEADESDGTLREFRPEHAIVLNVDADHLDYFSDLEAVCREFQNFAEHTGRLVVFCADEPRLAELFARRPGSVSYGFSPLAQYQIGAFAREGNGKVGSRFDVWRGGEKLGDFSIGLLGEKNASNAAAAIALLHQFGYRPADIATAVAPFRGAARRQEELFSDARFRLFDDYAHHPREVAATLQAFKGLGSRRMLVAFQPHRYTRTQHLLKEFATCFAGADRLWLTEVYAASEPEIPGITGAFLAETVGRTGQAVEFIKNVGDLRHAVRDALQPGDLVLFLGAGDITRAAHGLAADLREQIATDKEQFFAALSSVLSSASVSRQNEPLAKRTTLRVGGPADFYVEPASEIEVAAVVRVCAGKNVPFVILGRGSNLLIKDGGIRGVVISMTHPHFSRVEVIGERLHCGAGAKLKTVAVEARRQGLTGLEFLEGIPGSVGGALRMNAGAMGSWTFDVVEAVRFMDYAGLVQERRASEVYVEYRGCPLFKTHIALGAVFKGQPAAKEAIEQRMQTFSQKRWDTQPAASSAGCIFKNPTAISAGKLIDELGLKGTRVGGAVVSGVHGNFIVNDGHATAQDVLTLIEIVKQRAKTLRGIDLETEVEILGEGHKCLH